MAEPQHGNNNGRRNRNDEPERSPYGDDRSWRAPVQRSSPGMGGRDDHRFGGDETDAQGQGYGNGQGYRLGSRSFGPDPDWEPRESESDSGGSWGGRQERSDWGPSRHQRFGGGMGRSSYEQRLASSFGGSGSSDSSQGRSERFPSGGGYGWGAGYGSSGFSGWSEQGPAGRQQPQQGESFAGRGPKDYQRSDERIREQICDRFTDDHLLDATEITIQVQNGEVTISGQVADREQKRRAEDLAESISGVKDVTNHVRVERQQMGSERGQSSTGKEGKESQSAGRKSTSNL